jgi:protein tyrosine phosphatase (PTP) superfamily phosphohydrolase (DUF442 family)
VIDEIYNYRQIDARLATSGQPDEPELAAIAAAGYTVVINLALHDNPRYALADEPGTVASLGMKYVHIPVQFDAPTDADLERFFAVMDENSDTKLWVHCAANKRVSVFLGLYLYLRCGKPADEAFALQRDIWAPDAVWSQFLARKLGRTDK